MTTELTVLVLAALLQIVQMFIASSLMTRQLGTDYNMSPRDEPRVLTGMAGRAERAYRNHFESLAFFTIAVVAVVLGDKSGGLTAILAWVYLAARVAYVPAYLYGLSPWRSLCFLCGIAAIILMLIVALVS